MLTCSSCRGSRASRRRVPGLDEAVAGVGAASHPEFARIFSIFSDADCGIGGNRGAFPLGAGRSPNTVQTLHAGLRPSPALPRGSNASVMWRSFYSRACGPASDIDVGGLAQRRPKVSRCRVQRRRLQDNRRSACRSRAPPSSSAGFRFISGIARACQAAVSRASAR